MKKAIFKFSILTLLQILLHNFKRFGLLLYYFVKPFKIDYKVFFILVPSTSFIPQGISKLPSNVQPNKNMIKLTPGYDFLPTCYFAKHKK
jgi:hypothetical protein